jgi:hypothetical protein
MAKMVAWLPQLTEWLSWGCSTSVLLKNLENDVELQAARECCLDLWPFLKELPNNIAAIKDALPPNMQAASRLLNDLADEERYYQQLFLKQCKLSGLTPDRLQNYEGTEASKAVKELLSYQAQTDHFEDGLIRLTVVELAATAFSRAALPLFERYFTSNAAQYQRRQVDEGLEWLRVHVRPQTRNALLLLKTLGEIKYASQTDLPPAAANLLGALLDLWQCPVRDISTTETRGISA